MTMSKKPKLKPITQTSVTLDELFDMLKGHVARKTEDDSMKTKTCETCAWVAKNELNDLICCCGESDNCAEFMGSDDTCEYWEETKCASLSS